MYIEHHETARFRRYKNFPEARLQECPIVFYCSLNVTMIL